MLDGSIPRSSRCTTSSAFPWRNGSARRGQGRKVAVDAVFDSVSVATTFREELKKAGVIFLSISEAVKEYPELVKKWLGKVVPQHDNFFATLNSAVFSDGTPVYIPEGVRCPMGCRPISASTQRTPASSNAADCCRERLCQLSRRLHRADARREPAPRRSGRTGRARRCEIKYSTVQNWYPGNAEGKGGIYNFVTKRASARARGARSAGRRSKPAAW